MVVLLGAVVSCERGTPVLATKGGPRRERGLMGEVPLYLLQPLNESGGVESRGCLLVTALEQTGLGQKQCTSCSGQKACVSLGSPAFRC